MTDCDHMFTVVSEDTLVAGIDTSIYSIQAIFGTCYKFTDRCYVFLARGEDPSVIQAVFARKDAQSNISRVTGEFFNELIDQQVRVQVAAETAEVRTLIVAHAFSEGNLLDPTRENSDY